MVVLLDLTKNELNADMLCQMARLEKLLFDDNWHDGAILSVLSQFGAGVLVCLSDKTVVGYCIYQIVFDVAEVLRIATNPSHQRQGVGKMMLDKLIQLTKNKQAERLLLEVRADNASAIGLYQQQAFYQIDKRPRYYGGQVDALILQREL